MTRDMILAEAIAPMKLLPTESVAALIPVLQQYAGIDIVDVMKRASAPTLRVLGLEPVA